MKHKEAIQRLVRVAVLRERALCRTADEHCLLRARAAAVALVVQHAEALAELAAMIRDQQTPPALSGGPGRAPSAAAGPLAAAAQPPPATPAAAPAGCIGVASGGGGGGGERAPGASAPLGAGLPANADWEGLAGAVLEQLGRSHAEAAGRPVPPKPAPSWWPHGRACVGAALQITAVDELRAVLLRFAHSMGMLAP